DPRHLDRARERRARPVEIRHAQHRDGVQLQHRGDRQRHDRGAESGGLRRRARRDRGAARGHPPHRPRARDPRLREGAPGREARRHRRRARVRDELRHRPRLPGRRGLLPAARLLRQSAGRQRLRADRVHRRGAGRHGQLRRRARRRHPHRRGRVGGRPVARRIARPDRHLPHLHRGAAVPAARAVRSTFLKQLGIIGAFAAAVALVPVFVTSGSVLNMVIMTLYAALLGQAWNILGGFGGQFSFGHAVFFGTRAYAMAVLQTVFGINAWLALPAALLLGAAVGLLVGALSFRYGLKGSYFALVTLAFAEVFRILANTFQFTGAGVGIQLPLRDTAAEMQFPDKTGFLYAMLLLVTASLLVAWWLKRSRYGAWLQAVRDNEDSAAALGVNVFRVKLGALAISGALMAAGGAFYLQYYRYIDPHLAYGPAISVEALLA